MQKYLVVILIVVLLVSGCGPSEAELQATAQAGMEQTQAAVPTDTSVPTETPIPTALPSQITDDYGVAMVLVPEGEFTMGSNDGEDHEQPVHEVFLDTYYIDKYEVTNALYKVCVDAGVCDSPTTTRFYNDSQYAQHSVVYINWDMANEFCEWRGARLPTEAEWEKAARGTDGRTYPWGEEIDGTFANYDNNVGDSTPVGGYENGVSPYGAYDMAGNVFEWVADWHEANYYASSPEVSPTGPDSGDFRVVRGGGWVSKFSNVRAAYRLRYDPTDTNFTIGVRCSRSL